MNEVQVEDAVLAEIYPNTEYLNKEVRNSRKRQYRWRDVEIFQEKLELKKELMALRYYI